MLGAEAPAQGIAQLDIVELLITTQADQDRLLQPIFEPGQQEQHLEHLRGVPALGLAQGLDARLARRLNPLHRRSRRYRLRLWGQGDRALLIGGITTVSGGEDQILT